MNACVWYSASFVFIQTICWFLNSLGAIQTCKLFSGGCLAIVVLGRSISLNLDYGPRYFQVCLNHLSFHSVSTGRSQETKLRLSIQGNINQDSILFWILKPALARQSFHKTELSGNTKIFFRKFSISEKKIQLRQTIMNHCYLFLYLLS